MAAGDKKTPPAVTWAQRTDKIYLTINLSDCKDPSIELTENKLCFKGKGGPDNELHEVEIEFYGEVNPEQSKYVVLPRNIPMVLIRKEEGEYWPRLLKEKVKVHWLKTDFDKWKDEDESDDDEPSMPDGMSGMGGMGGMGGDLNSMMANMGNFNPDDAAAEDGDADGEADSDDEDLPDLA